MSNEYIVRNVTILPSEEYFMFDTKKKAFEFIKLNRHNMKLTLSRVLGEYEQEIEVSK